MVKGNITNPEVYVVFHYPVFVFAIFPSASTVTLKRQGGENTTFYPKDYKCCHAKTSCSGKILTTQLKMSSLQLRLSSFQVRALSKSEKNHN